MNAAFTEIRTIERKKRELVVLQLLIIGFLTIAVIVLSLLEQKFLTLLFLGILALLFSLYIVDKERELKRLNNTLLEEQLKNIEQKIRTTSIQEKLAEMKILYKVARISVSTRDLQRRLDQIFHAAVHLTGANRGSIMLVDQQLQQFVFACTHGLEPHILHGMRQRMKEGVAGWVVENKMPLILTGRTQDERFKNPTEKKDDFVSSISLPLKIRGKVIGTFHLSYLKPSQKVFNDHDIRRLSIFAHYLSLALQNPNLKKAVGVNS